MSAKHSVPEQVPLDPGVSAGLRCPFTGHEQTVVCRKVGADISLYSLRGGFDPYAFSRDSETLEASLRRRASGKATKKLVCPYTGKAISIEPFKPAGTLASGFIAISEGFHPSEWRPSLDELLRFARMRAGTVRAPESTESTESPE